MRRFFILALVVAATVVACGDDDAVTTTTAPVDPGSFPADAFAFVASSDLAIGRERLLVAVSNPNGTRLSSPEIAVTITVWLEGRDLQRQVLPADFIWAIPDVSGLYKVSPEFDVPGIWVVSVQPDGGTALAEFPIQVQEFPRTVAVGEPAPRSDSVTVADAPLEEITSATDPDPSLYQMSIADAVTSGRPSVIVFATPKFCQTAICGPTLDRILEIKPSYPDVNFLHVEVFTNLDDPENLTTVPAVDEWGLPTEPWVFVVDAGGIVVARFEGVVGPAEIAAALGA
ncbi:MAG TPA: hypothetical protein VJA44_05720 [Acidimicrobiia bacterium]|nr:hypothetical protein [Acidimicrobiia bacterium]